MARLEALLDYLKYGIHWIGYAELLPAFMINVAMAALVGLGAAEFFYPLLHFLQPGILWPEIADMRPMIMVAGVALLRSLGRDVPGQFGAILWNPAFRWFLAFQFLSVISLYRGGLGVMKDEFMFLLPLALFTVVSIRLVTNEKQLLRYVYGMIWGCMVVIVYGLLAVFLHWDSAVGGRAGAYGMYENHNDFTFIIVMVLPFIAAMYRMSTNGLLRLALLVSGLLSMLGVFLSLSRGGMMALALEAGILLFVYGKRKQVMWMLPVLLVVSLVAVQYQFRARAENQGSHYTAEDAESSRLELWRAAGAIIKAHPLLGVGSRVFGEVSEEYGEISHDNRGKNAHNTYVEVLADSGLLGFGAFGLMLFHMLQLLRPRPGERRGGGVDVVRGAALTSLATIMFRSFLDAKQFDFSFFLLVAVTVMCTVLRPRLADDKAVPADGTLRHA